jgi:hypothetical protein
MFNQTGGSLIPGSLMHLSINFATAATGVVASAPLYGLTVGVLVIAAGTVVLVFGTQRLMRAPSPFRVAPPGTGARP